MNIVLDTDIGSDIDDTMALLLCLRLSELSVKAVTTVYGQTGIRAKVAKKLLNLAGVDVPVAVGESAPISSRMKVWHAGIEGQGILDEDEMRAPPSVCGVLPDAVDLLVRTAGECKQDLDVVAIGPLTNLARAIQRDPEFRSNVRCIWAMIGGVTYPDRPPDRALVPGEAFIARASHNVRCDVGAARIVLESGIPVVMVGNDVTTRCRIDLPGIDKIEQHGGDVDQAVVRMMRTWLQYRSELFGRPVTWTCLHDALVVAEAYGMGFTQRDPVDVEISDDAGTMVTANPDSHIEVCRTVRKTAFEEWYLDIVAGSNAERSATPSSLPQLLWGYQSNPRREADVWDVLEKNHDWINYAEPEWHDTPLSIASRHGSLAFMKWLLAQGADVDDRSLLAAAGAGQAEAVRLLLAAGADLHCSDCKWASVTPLYLAAEKGHAAVVSLLLAHGADPHRGDWLQENSHTSTSDHPFLGLAYGDTPLHAAASCGHKVVTDIIRQHLLREQTADVKEAKFASLHIAAKEGNIEDVCAHLARGADIDAQDRDGWTPLHHAACAGHLKVVQYLVMEGAIIDIRDSTRSYPLHYALQIGDEEVARFLLWAGAKE